MMHKGFARVFTAIVFALAVPFFVYAQERFAKELRRLSPASLEVIDGGGKSLVTLDFYGENIFRLFSDPKGGAIRNPESTPPAQILADAPRGAVSPLQTEDRGKYFSVRSKEIEVRISKASGLLSVFDLKRDKKVLEETAPVTFAEGKTTVVFANSEDRGYYGGGVQNGRFAHKGEEIRIFNSNNWVDGGVASPAPYFWSTAGYGILWHTFKPGSYDFGKKDPSEVRLSHDTDYLDLFVMVSEKPEALLGDYYRLTGNPVLLPKFALYEGHLNAYNRDFWKETDEGGILFEDGKRYKESQKDNGGVRESLNGEKDNYQFSARAVVDRYAAHDMPLGWVLPNDGYGAGYGQTNTLEGNVQNLKEFGDYARSKGVEIGLWTQSDLHPKEGVEPLLQRDIVREVRDAGVRVLKTDVAWVGAGYSFGLNGINDVAGITTKYGGGARPFIITLDGWAGTQRYAGVWTGDQTGGEWEYIRFHIPTYIGAGLSGLSNITSDMDGIFGGNNSPVLVRDFQWKTFTLMQLNMDGWGSTPKYPHILGEPSTSINRSYLKWKSMLVPYAYSIGYEAVTGKPAVRALFLDFPNHYTLGTETRYEYLYGPYFLIAPVYKETNADKDGNDIRNGIYLPEGTWYDYFTGEKYSGDRIWNEFPAPIWKLPVFVKAGAVIPLTKPHNQPRDIPSDYRAYEIYGGAETTFDEYDDDGHSEAYKDGAGVHTLLSLNEKGNTLTFTADASKGSFDGFNPLKETELFWNLSAKPSSVTASYAGKKVRLGRAKTLEEYRSKADVWYFNPSPELNRFSTPGLTEAKRSLPKNPQLWVKVGKRDITSGDLSVTVRDARLDLPSSLFVSHGKLSEPALLTGKAEAKAFSPSWSKVEGADAYDIDFGGMLYSGIRGASFRLEDLKPETVYDYKVRAVNADGVSGWSSGSFTTLEDPYRLAVKNIRGQSSAASQPGQGVDKLFDFDKNTIWHTSWSEPAVPFTLTLDLVTLNDLDRLEYYPRKDAGNGTLIRGSVSVSADRQTWSEEVPFSWKKDAEMKTISFPTGTKARWIRLSVSDGVGNFGSGSEVIVYRRDGTKPLLQGDINHDERLDENDLTSYLNYTGLRTKDSDFDYIKEGDINANGLIDAYDISVVATTLDGGASARSRDKAEGRISLTQDRTQFKAGEEIVLTIEAKDLRSANALSFALPYDASLLEYVGMDKVGMKELYDLTNDRLHTDGTKELFPTFVNIGNNFLLEDGTLMKIRFRARKTGSWTAEMRDGLIVDRSLGTSAF
ncbi:MAG: DUF5110 domain-containing protein [Bacteroidales bacterium]|nr:DUF5110 domain-containing protein [Bacteroidales bacterium]